MPATRCSRLSEGAGQRLPDDGGPGLLVGGQRVQPAPQRRHLVLRAAGRRRSGRSSMTNSRAPASPARCSIPARSAATSRRRLRRHPVEHDGQRGAALLRRPEQVPGDGVGVAGRRRDEDPQVGRRQQLTGELAVGLHHRVDVGGVEQGEAGGQVVADDELHRARARRPSR